MPDISTPFFYRPTDIFRQLVIEIYESNRERLKRFMVPSDISDLYRIG